jgi:hypothetical protein
MVNYRKKFSWSNKQVQLMKMKLKAILVSNNNYRDGE